MFPNCCCRACISFCNDEMVFFSPCSWSVDARSVPLATRVIVLPRPDETAPPRVEGPARHHCQYAIDKVDIGDFELLTNWHRSGGQRQIQRGFRTPSTTAGCTGAILGMRGSCSLRSVRGVAIHVFAKRHLLQSNQTRCSSGGGKNGCLKQTLKQNRSRRTISDQN
mgnify:CR=1 FL=1